MKSPSHYHYCSKKVKYVSEEIANRSAEILNFHSYRCPKCQFWHLTHNPPINPEAETVNLIELAFA